MAKQRESEELENRDDEEAYIEYDAPFWDDTEQFAPLDQTEGTHIKHIKRRKPNQ